ncbi:MAG TPA: PEMT/PEM2 methyltransferase family protein [Candidatus Nitrosopolaris sp.]|nr:PEMT/PEM2 methyltransferase family protein [Candidatus Nitrosopolaris sp.]
MTALARLTFSLVILCVVLEAGALALSVARPDLRIWPPPRRHSWQFVVNGVLSYTTLLGVVALGLLDWNSFVIPAWVRPVGGLLIASGAAFALWGFLTLGSHASQGLGGDLVASGPYRYSRNPQYVGTVGVLVGWAVLNNSALALIAAVLASGWFVALPCAEEPWLRDRFGTTFEKYAAGVPRFLSLRRRSATRPA